MYNYISLLFSCMLVHGSPPAGLLLSSIVPTPKDKRRNRSNSANYRAIALGSLFCNMFDNIVLDKHYDNLMSNELQFGYKKGVFLKNMVGCSISPILFGIYMDNLIKHLKDSNIGCKIGNNYVGVFCYADDLTLLSPTLTELKCMHNQVNV